MGQVIFLKSIKGSLSRIWLDSEIWLSTAVKSQVANRNPSSYHVFSLYQVSFNTLQHLNFSAFACNLSEGKWRVTVAFVLVSVVLFWPRRDTRLIFRWLSRAPRSSLKVESHSVASCTRDGGPIISSCKPRRYFFFGVFIRWSVNDWRLIEHNQP